MTGTRRSASAASWVAGWRKSKLAFDHRRIITDALRLGRADERHRAQ